METKATLKVVRTREKCVLIYWKIENATLSSLSGMGIKNGKVSWKGGVWQSPLKLSNKNKT